MTKTLAIITALLLAACAGTPETYEPTLRYGYWFTDHKEQVSRIINRGQRWEKTPGGYADPMVIIECQPGYGFRLYFGPGESFAEGPVPASIVLDDMDPIPARMDAVHSGHNTWLMGAPAGEVHHNFIRLLYRHNALYLMLWPAHPYRIGMQFQMDGLGQAYEATRRRCVEQGR